MIKIISLALLVGGLVVLIIGFLATNSFSLDVSNYFYGSPADRVAWMLTGGTVAVVIGLIGVVRGSRPA
jgi:hypothetical protein